MTYNERVKFDVFLCHNSQDKPEVIEIGRKLQEQGLKPWLDEWELQPGLPWQRELEKQIQNIKSAAVFVGGTGVGPWQKMEIEAYLRKFVNQGCPVIPVLLSKAPNQHEQLPIFLEGITWVDFRRSRPEPMGRLIWGITGKKPSSQSTTSKPTKNSNIEKKLASAYEDLPQSDEIKLKSEKGVDYTKLQDLLAKQKWKEADQETANVILQAAERPEKHYLATDDIDKFPCEDLRTINQLWLHYSKGKFGFSVQKEIYESLGGTRQYNQEVWYKFCNRVGWKKGGTVVHFYQLTFDVELAPPAHLPSVLNSDGNWSLGKGALNCNEFLFFYRAKTCDL